MPTTAQKRATDSPIRVLAIPPHVAAMVQKPITGRGGFQTLFRRIQAGLRGCILRLDERDLDRLVGLASSGKTGGYQQRAELLLAGVFYWDLFIKPKRLKVLPFERRERQGRLRFEADK